MSRPPSASRHQRMRRLGWSRPYRGVGGRRDKGHVATRFPVTTRVLVSILSGGVLVSRAVPCVPALVDGPSGGFRKGCCACLCLLGLSWLRANGVISVVVAPLVFLFAQC
ncbi:hypothetical protein Taro_032145 [Colocasia esculenta]|uniref:Uncharacterized protein n=1 Tax=Colocasia esculenta TaxID=4460 RepID=A0A843VQM8_COLES|nr:hypothetical protein [Colocasia esculenta]